MKGIFATVVLISCLCVVAYGATCEEKVQEAQVVACNEKLRNTNNVTEAAREAFCKECGSTLYDALILCELTNEAAELKKGITTKCMYM